MNVSVSFLIVRHPFERLLSAYRDKIMFAIPHSLHDKLGIKIIRKYRKNVSYSHFLIFFKIVFYFLQIIIILMGKFSIFTILYVHFCLKKWNLLKKN